MGRDVELRASENLCGKTVRGKGSLLWLSGLENIGKSRILEQALAMGRSQNLDVIVSYCNPKIRALFNRSSRSSVRVTQNLPRATFEQILGKSRGIECGIPACVA